MYHYAQYPRLPPSVSPTSPEDVRCLKLVWTSLSHFRSEVQNRCAQLRPRPARSKHNESEGIRRDSIEGFDVGVEVLAEPKGPVTSLHDTLGLRVLCWTVAVEKGNHNLDSFAHKRDQKGQHTRFGASAGVSFRLDRKNTPKGSTRWCRLHGNEVPRTYEPMRA